MFGSSSLFFGDYNREIITDGIGENCYFMLLGEEHVATPRIKNGLKRKLDDSMEEDNYHHGCYDDEEDQQQKNNGCCYLSTTSTMQSTQPLLLEQDGNLFREVKRVKTSLTLSHLQSSDSILKQDQTISTIIYPKESTQIVYNNLKITPKSPPKTKTNPEKSLSSDVNLMKEIWRRKLQSSLMSQSTGVSQLPNPRIDILPEYDFDEPEERAVIPNSIPREELMRRLRNRIDSASNGRQQRFDDPHSTGISSDEFEYMADD